MIIARMATEQDREVFAVPGSIFSSQSRGPNSLIRDGASPVTHAEDVLEALNLTQIAAQLDFSQVMPDTNEDELAVLDALIREPTHTDLVVLGSGLAAAKVSGTLAMLDLKGLARDVGGMQYVRLREELAEYHPESTAIPNAPAGERAAK
jgi:DNA processing protein